MSIAPRLFARLSAAVMLVFFQMSHADPSAAAEPPGGQGMMQVQFTYRVLPEVGRFVIGARGQDFQARMQDFMRDTASALGMSYSYDEFPAISAHILGLFNLERPDSNVNIGGNNAGSSDFTIVMVAMDTVPDRSAMFSKLFVAATQTFGADRVRITHSEFDPPQGDPT